MDDQGLVDRVVEIAAFPITEVVSGKARGVDKCGERWADRNGIPVKDFPADWAKHGNSAGPIRNEAMAEYADALIVIPLVAEDPTYNSKGSVDMMRRAIAHNLQVFVWFLDFDVWQSVEPLRSRLLKASVERDKLRTIARKYKKRCEKLERRMAHLQRVVVQSVTSFHEVECIKEDGGILICELQDGNIIKVDKEDIDVGSEVWGIGDSGLLTISLWPTVNSGIFDKE